MSRTATGNGYWLFTSRGRALTCGDAVFRGDMSQVRLNGPVLDAIPTRSGDGYFMVASDGGIFSFGDARFHGSMGSRPLNAPVVSLVPDPDAKVTPDSAITPPPAHPPRRPRLVAFAG